MTGTLKAVFAGLGAMLQGYGAYKTATACSVALRDVFKCEAQILTIHKEINDWTDKMDRHKSHHLEHLESLHDRLRFWKARANACDQRLQRAER